jgi:hypothetical protein
VAKAADLDIEVGQAPKRRRGFAAVEVKHAEDHLVLVPGGDVAGDQDAVLAQVKAMPPAV